MSAASRVNTRALAHNLLAAIEYRGSHASGFAFVKGDEYGVYKNPVPGSQLLLGDMPRRAQSGILHTRFATQGAVTDNRNNHPVLSPSGQIALVHNGVISNDMMFRGNAQDRWIRLPDVDSAVIPALIERDGVREGIAQLEGYAALAWLDQASHFGRVLHLARPESSPVAYTWLMDGSFVFASTKFLLMTALDMSGLDYGHVFEMDEKVYLKVLDGVIVHQQDDVEMIEDSWTYWRHASATAGGHKGSEGGIGSSFGFRAADPEGYDDDSPTDDNISGYANVRFDWDDEYDDTVAMAMAPETNEPVWVRDGNGELVLRSSVTEAETVMGYYLETEDHDLQYFETLEKLESYLDWLSNMNLYEGCPFPDAEKSLRWTNFVIDMGHVNAPGGMESWLTDLAMLDQHESPAVYNLRNIREGLTKIVEVASI